MPSPQKFRHFFLFPDKIDRFSDKIERFSDKIERFKQSFHLITNRFIACHLTRTLLLFLVSYLLLFLLFHYHLHLSHPWNVVSVKVGRLALSAAKLQGTDPQQLFKNLLSPFTRCLERPVYRAFPRHRCLLEPSPSLHTSFTAAKVLRKHLSILPPFGGGVKDR